MKRVAVNNRKKRYRIRNGSIAEAALIFFASSAFWASWFAFYLILSETIKKFS